ncbi:hypothetical protein MTO96_016144 [Rhipicephalus appendiculatus]
MHLKNTITPTFDTDRFVQVELQPGSEVAQSVEGLFVQCKRGYEFIDGIGKTHQRPLHCHSGSWQPPGPWCREQPCRNYHVPGGEPEFVDLLHNQVINVTCKPYHERQTKQDGRTPMCRFGSILGDVPTCKPANCVVQADHSAAVIRQTRSRGNKEVELQPGSEVAHSEGRIFVQCKRGYEFIKDFGRTHQRPLRCNTGSWQPPGPWCREQPCRNIRVEGSEPGFMYLLPGEVMNFTCKPNHKLQKKQNGRTPVCRLGRIEGDVPTCKPDDCRFEDLQNLVNGGKPRLNQPTSHDSFAVYDCESSLVLEGPGRLRCSSGHWTGEPPKCVPRKECIVPYHAGSKVLQLRWPSYIRKPTEVRPGTVVKEGHSGLIVKCEDGYNFGYQQHRREKQATVQCTNGAWYPKDPWCEEIHPEVSPRHCTLPPRENRFKAHLAHIRKMPLDSGKARPDAAMAHGFPPVPYCYGRESRELNDIHIYFRTEAYTVPGGEVYVEPNTKVVVDCWSSTPVIVASTNQQTETGGFSGGHFFSSATFTVPLGQVAYVACRKVGDYADRYISVRGHHLYMCPEIPKMDHMEVRRKNKEVYEFSCHKGYRLQGKRTIHCLGQGVWSDLFPTCVSLIEASSAGTSELKDDSPMNKSTPVAQGPESTHWDTVRHGEQGMKTKPAGTRDTSFVDEPSNRTEEPDTKGDRGHKRRNESASHPQHFPQSATNQRPMQPTARENGLNNTQVEVHETSSSSESTTGLVTSVNASTQYVPMPPTVHEEVQPALDLISRNESSGSVICAHRTASGICSDPVNRSRPTQKNTDHYPVETAAGVPSELQTTAPERHEERDFNVYSNDSSRFNTRFSNRSADLPPQEVKPKPQSSSFDDLLSVTGRPNVSSSADVPPNPLRPDGAYEPSSTKVHPDLPPANCTLPERRNRFKAHHKDIPILPLHSVPHGTELTFHCEPAAEMILKGPDTSRCLNGQWIPPVPYCYGRGSRELDDIYMYFSTEAYTVPGGEVYVEPNREVLVDCWSTTPMHLFTATKAQFLRKWSDGHYVLRASFTLLPDQQANITCNKTDGYNSFRVIGHHLYSCPQGYSLQGKGTIHCLGHGVWSDPLPWCVSPIEASSAPTTEPEDDYPMNKMNKSTPVVKAQDGCQPNDFLSYCVSRTGHCDRERDSTTEQHLLAFL